MKNEAEPKIQMELEVINENVILKKLICCKISEQKESLKGSRKTGTCFFSFFNLEITVLLSIAEMQLKYHKKHSKIMMKVNIS